MIGGLGVVSALLKPAARKGSSESAHNFSVRKGLLSFLGWWLRWICSQNYGPCSIQSGEPLGVIHSEPGTCTCFSSSRWAPIFIPFQDFQMSRISSHWRAINSSILKQLSWTKANILSSFLYRVRQPSPRCTVLRVSVYWTVTKSTTEVFVLQICTVCMTMAKLFFRTRMCMKLLKTQKDL